MSTQGNRGGKKTNELDKCMSDFYTLKAKMPTVMTRKRALDSKERTIKKLKIEVDEKKRENVELLRENDELWETVIENEESHQHWHSSLEDKLAGCTKKIVELKDEKHGLQKKLSRVKVNAELVQKDLIDKRKIQF